MATPAGSFFCSVLTVRPAASLSQCGGMSAVGETQPRDVLDNCVTFTDEAHFTDDLGADWLDRLDLMIALEDQFPGLEITDDIIDRIELVGDLIRHIETLDSERRRRGAAPVFRTLFGPHVVRAMKPTKQ